MNKNVSEVEVKKVPIIVDFDAKVLKYIAINETLKTLTDEKETLKTELEGLYVMAPEVEEIITGNVSVMKKIPVNKGKNSYDTAKLALILARIGEYETVIKEEVIRKCDIDIKALAKLVKNKKIDVKELDWCRLNNWTFKSDFSKK